MITEWMLLCFLKPDLLNFKKGWMVKLEEENQVSTHHLHPSAITLHPSPITFLSVSLRTVTQDIHFRFFVFIL